MAFNGSGTFNRNTGVYTGSTAWTQTRDAARKVRADDHDTHDQDIANGLSNCVTKDGQTTITANLPMAGFRHTNCGNGVADTDYSTVGQIKAGVTFNSSAKIKGDFSNATVGSRTAFQTSTTNGNTLLEVIPDGTATTAQITLNGASDPANTATFQVQNVGTEVRLNASKRGTGSYTPMTFYTSDLERMRIAANGRVGISTTNPSHALTVGDGTGTIEATVNGANSGTGGGAAVSTRVNGTAVIAIGNLSGIIGGTYAANPTIWGSGTTFKVVNLTAGAGTNAMKWDSANNNWTYDTSSARFKENIRPSQYGLNAVKQLAPKQFAYIEGKREDVGFIAEEVAPVLPELVMLDKDGLPESVSYDRLTAVLCKAIQELSARVEALEAGNL